MFNPKFSVILGNVGSCCDRYLSTGYSDPFTIDEMFDRVATVGLVKGVELVANWHINSSNVDQIKNNILRTGLKLVSIIPDHFGQKKWGKGAFTSKDSAVRLDAINHTKEMMDIAAELGCNMVSLWPGQDGYDYYFQADYIEARSWFEEGIKECCKYRNDVKVSIEYKQKEPRNRSYPSTVFSTLLMVNEIAEANCGVTIDYGHALVAYENVAESVAVLKKYGDKLYHIHMNDNYGFWDDDMITGSIHTIPYLEFLYWLKITNYQGWISTDQYPYREDGKEAVNESIQWMLALINLVNRMDGNEVESVIKSGNAVLANKMLRKYMFNT
jgi:Sugar phosphate isomerases/epimerases